MDLDRIKRARGVSLVVAVNDRYGADSGGYMAATIAYYGFFSILALTALALSVVGFVLAGDPAAQQRFVDTLTGSIPGIGGLIGDQIHPLVKARFVTLAVGLVGLLLTGTGAVNASGWALGRIFRVGEYRGFWKKKAWSLASLMGLGVIALIGTSVAGVVAGVGATGWWSVLLWMAGLLVSFALDFVLFIVAYRILLQRRGPAWRQLVAGAVLAGAGWTLLKLLGTWYVSRTVASSQAVYGTFGTMVGILALLYLAARLFLYGAELNAVLIERRGNAPVQEAIEPGGGAVAEQAERHEDMEATTGPAPIERAAPASSNGQEARSTPELIRAIAGDTATLVRKEVELARQEIVEAVVAKVKGVAALGVGGVMALFGLLFLAVGGALALALVLPVWAAFLIVAGGFLLMAGALALFGKLRISKQPLAPVETKRTVKEDVRWAKAQLRR
ncbi:MAG TPA: YhjD/YihY/BrkB family envelope integrity protein [Actinomycetota bacterium]